MDEGVGKLQDEEVPFRLSSLSLSSLRLFQRSLSCRLVVARVRLFRPLNSLLPWQASSLLVRPWLCPFSCSS